MKINHLNPADVDGDPNKTVPARPLPRTRLTADSSRLAANAAGAALAGSSVSLAFFLARKPTASPGLRYAKFRA